MTGTVFKGSFTQQEPIGEEAIEAAVRVLRSGRLHRYNVAPGELAETALLEQEFAAWQGARYCLASASGGYAMQVALRAWGVEPGEPVLTNAFTLSPVPGSIAAVGGRPVLVETTEQLTLDLDDLAAKIDTSGARLLLISHMRGHLVDMDALMAVLERRNVALIEDCAHTMGASWGGRRSGSFGVAACFSTQTYKHLNSGEGGLMTTDDAELMARAVILSGSYMLYERHLAGPPPETYADIRLDTPNCSGRMDNLRAAILRPQLAGLETNVERWNERYRAVEAELQRSNGLQTPCRPEQERYVGSSIQFLTGEADPAAARAFIECCRARGVELKWFGAEEPQGYTSRHDSWRYVAHQELPKTDALLSRLFDMRLPLTFSVEDCRLIGRIIVECHAETMAASGATS
ncbi:DegT/DnrJ/EryC1/StrS aminotransferase family protein [Geminicoccaceae bacterium 1502E]|nr:DegT/DnrJ/EryC1/StrS aminotransferase family protein [Geminicoccaceae bacterium 1502E]